MSVKIGKIAEYMEELAPCKLAEEWDNVGLLVGNFSYETNRILLALDATTPVIDEAIEKGCSMILTHHPITRAGMKKINDGDALGRRVLKLIENRIALYSAHTNLDKTDGGVNDNLCEIFELTDVTVKKDKDGNNDMLRYGKLKEPVALSVLAKKYEEILRLPYLPISGDCDTIIKTVAIVGGNGMGLLPEVIASGVDLFISGDIRYHDANEAAENGLCMMDLTHYGSEVTVLKPLAAYLERKRDADGLSFECIISATDSQPFRLCK